MSDLQPTSETTLPFIDAKPTAIREQIGTQRRFFVNFRSPWDSFQDNTITDYKFWDKARRGKARGLPISGLLLRPLSSKICSWVLGDSPLWQSSNSKLSKSLNQWWQQWQASFMRSYQEALDLGDCYAVFNGDGSVTVVPPNVVERILDENDLQTLIGYRITTSFSEDSGSKAQTFVDEYYATYRTHTAKDFNGVVMPDATKRYRNPLGKIPVVHVTNRFGADEIYGRPLGEPLLPTLQRYGDVFDAALKGNIRQGRPTPVISKMGTASQVEEFWERYGSTETVTAADGTTETITVINFDPDMLLTLGGDATFKYEAPGSFSVDTLNLLGLLFYLILQHSEIPEAYMGNAISGSKASAESQIEPFLRYIKKMRGLAMDWIQELADLFVAWTGTFNRVARDTKVTALWKPLTATEARLMLDADIWLYAKKLIDPTLALWVSPLGITDPEAVAQRAQDYWGDGFGLGVSPSANAAAGDSANSQGGSGGIPASGGGTQDQFNRQTDPVQTTARSMEKLIEPVITEQNPQSNGKHHEPITI